MAAQTPEVGPVDIVMIGFDGNEFHGEIAPALLDLVQEGIVRLLDVCTCTRTPTGRTRVRPSGC
jgi:uncharacterized membrane protein